LQRIPKVSPNWRPNFWFWTIRRTETGTNACNCFKEPGS